MHIVLRNRPVRCCEKLLRLKFLKRQYRGIYADLTNDAVIVYSVSVSKSTALSLCYASIETPVANPVTTTAATVLVLFDRAVFAADMLVFSFEIIRVTAGTEWRVL
jgi:hypothetical protein